MNDAPRTRTVLFLIVGVAVFVTVIFADALSFRTKTENPALWLGIETVELTQDVKRQYDLQVASGLLVSRLFVGSPAEGAGIKEGDVILRWNGISVTNQDQFQYLIQTSQTSERIIFTVDRQGQQLLVFGRVGMRPGGL